MVDRVCEGGDVVTRPLRHDLREGCVDKMVGWGVLLERVCY